MVYKNKIVISAQNENELINFLNEIGTDNQKIDFNRIIPITANTDNEVEIMQEQWGCCSNAMEVEYDIVENYATIWFETRGGNCEEVISKLSHIGKDIIQITYLYASDTIAERCGKIESYGNDYTITDFGERTDSALECWCECWEEDMDMFVWDDEYECYMLNDGEEDDEWYE